MCGVVGEVRFGAQPDHEGVRRATQALAHRGPDAEGFFSDGVASLGHRRLSILDLAGGVQPMVQERVALVFNGQAYEHDELREELRGLGHPFGTRSDTEVVLRAYLQWGESFAARVHGMFAIGLWDARDQSLTLARDRLGKKPLYYALQGAGGEWLTGEPPEEGESLPAARLLFASELKALLAHGAVPRTLDRQAMVQYLAAEAVPAPRSILAAVRKLPAGCTARFDGRTFRVRRYWELPAPEPTAASVDEAGAELVRLLERAVSRRLVADVPVGVFLSGGVDSSCIAALAARHKQPLDTFSIGFSEASFDETPWAELVSARLGTRHQVQMLSGSACVDLLPDAVRTLDEPLADPSFLPTLLLSRFTRKHVTVALAGDGGDELFAGYDPFLAHRPAALLSRGPRALHRLLSRAASFLPASSKNMSLDFRAKQFLRGVLARPSLRHASWIAAWLPAELERLLLPDLRPLAAEARVFSTALDDARRAQELGLLPGSVDEALRYYVQRYLADDILVKADRASMCASLELRAPFLDTHVVEFAARLPWRMKLGLTRTKVVLKRALRGVVPDEVLRRPKKGFGIPVAAWIRGPLRPWFEELFEERSLAATGLFEPLEARRALDRHLRGEADLRKPLWTLAMLLAWRKQWRID
jgi:asparagine synthase (glutamine-hydrolysing)